MAALQLATDMTRLAQSYLQTPYLTYVGLGTFTWLLWLLRRIKGIRYKPVEDGYDATTSVIIPVYKEKPDILPSTLNAILANQPGEVITVIDHTDKELISLVMRRYPSVRIIVDGIPGKRPALAEGIREARNDIVVLVDSDTRWRGTDFLRELLKPFSDPKVGGVSSRQSVANTGSSFCTRIAGWWLDIRYFDYLPGQSAGGVVTCLSGRTAAYRRQALLPLLDDLLSETFWGRQCVGGDDGRLTLLVLKAGFKTAYQATAEASTYFPEDFVRFVKQRIRWSRNSYRAYLRAIKEGWIFRRSWILPVTIVHMIASPFVLIASVVAMAYAIITGNYLIFAVLVSWALIGRAVKSLSHLSRSTKDVIYLPLFEAYNRLVYPIIKAYSLVTMYRQDWLGSRGDYALGERLTATLDGGDMETVCALCGCSSAKNARFCDSCGVPLRPFVEINHH